MCICRRKLVEPDPMSMKMILSRLPTRSVMRFRSACKLWYLLTHDSDFAEWQLQNGPDKDRPGLIIVSQPTLLPELCLYRFEDDRSLHHKFRLKVINRKDEALAMSNSCNGLVCLFFWELTIVVNPCTKDFRLIPGSSCAGAHSFAAGGLGFDTFTGKYKVVRMYLGVGTMMVCEIFSLGSWRRIDDAPCDLYHAKPLSIDGMLFWSGGRHSILAFDVRNEVFSTIPFPEGDWSSWCHSLVNILDSAGRLHLSVNTLDNKKVNLYVMIDGSEWVLLYTIDFEMIEGWSCFDKSRPVALWDGRILFTNDSCKLDYYDTRNGRFDHVCRLRAGSLCFDVVHTESLVSPSAIQQGTASEYLFPLYSSLGCRRGDCMGNVGLLSTDAMDVIKARVSARGESEDREEEESGSYLESEGEEESDNYLASDSHEAPTVMRNSTTTNIFVSLRCEVVFSSFHA